MSDEPIIQIDETGSASAADQEPEIDYQPFPQATAVNRPVWRIRFETHSGTAEPIGFDLNDEAILGRDSDSVNLIDLSDFGAAQLGVSREHLLIRPTATNLFAIDLDSTNGTMRNGRNIGIGSPANIVNDDTITLGKMEITIHILTRPSMQTTLLDKRPTVEQALSQIAKAITSQLDLDEVLNQVAETAMTLTSAGETGIWLVDEFSGELFLEAQRGIKDESIRRMRLPIRDDTLVGQVIMQDKSIRASRQPGKALIKVKTGYLVEALAYVPINLAGVTLGVLSATHQDEGKRFNQRDEQLLEAIADFAAIAVQNARLYQATDKELQRRVQELAAVNELSRTVTASLDLNRVYNVLVSQVNKQWPVAAIRLYLLDEISQRLHLHTKKVTDTGPLSITLGIIGRVAREKKVIIANDPINHPDYDVEIDQYDNTDPTTLAVIPLRIQERTVGVLALFDKSDGPFTDEDVERLLAFAYPVATAIENAHLFAQSERQRAAIMATSQTLTQPLLILDPQGNVLIANEAANVILNHHMSQLFEGISTGVGRTSEVKIGDKTYLSSVQHLTDVGTIVVMQDITYVKKLEQDRSDFMHALSHDLKSPLTSVVGWAQLIEKAVPLNNKGQRYVDKLLGSAERMLDMINQMLQTVAKGDSVKVDRGPCKMERIINDAINDVEGSAKSKKIQVVFTEEGDSFPVMADAQRIYHMVLNLLDNAVKYSPPNTQITINLSHSDDQILIVIRDQGEGIPEKDLPRLFDKYYRGDKAKIQPGVGLGLSVVWAIADAHGGWVSARNVPGEGAEFSVTLPGSLRLTSDLL